MTPEQELLQDAVFADDKTVRQIIRAIGDKIAASVVAADVVKLRLVRIAVRAIAAARWGATWETR